MKRDSLEDMHRFRLNFMPSVERDKRFSEAKKSYSGYDLGDKKMLEDIFNISLYILLLPQLLEEDQHTSIKT